MWRPLSVSSGSPTACAITRASSPAVRSSVLPLLAPSSLTRLFFCATSLPGTWTARAPTKSWRSSRNLLASTPRPSSWSPMTLWLPHAHTPRFILKKASSSRVRHPASTFWPEVPHEIPPAHFRQSLPQENPSHPHPRVVPRRSPSVPFSRGLDNRFHPGRGSRRRRSPPHRHEPRPHLRDAHFVRRQSPRHSRRQGRHP